jgi:phosphoenolpyruvate carboxylase
VRSLNSLEKRIEALESSIPFGADPLEFAISNLSDNDLGLLSEYRELHVAGFDTEEVRDMIGSESYDLAIAVMQKVNDDLERLTAPPSRKLVAGKKMRAVIDGRIGGTKRQRKSDPEPDMGIDNGAF